MSILRCRDWRLLENCKRETLHPQPVWLDATESATALLVLRILMLLEMNHHEKPDVSRAAYTAFFVKA